MSLNLAGRLYEGAARCHRAAGRECSAIALTDQAERIRAAVLADGTSRLA